MGAFSKLHNYTYRELQRNLPALSIKENAYPDWLVSSNLTRLELDIYIEELNLAIEIQGAQHYKFIPFFHGDYENFEKRKMYDQEKKDLCYGKGIRLVEICTEIDVDIFVQEIKSKNTDILSQEEYNRIEAQYVNKRLKCVARPLDKKKGMSKVEIKERNKLQKMYTSDCKKALRRAKKDFRDIYKSHFS